MIKVEDMKKELIETCVKLIQKDLTHGTCGNISCKIPSEKKILITPSRIPYEIIKSDRE